MRIVFAGSPAAAVPSLRALAVSGHELMAVVTREDSPIGRRRVLTPTPVAAAARELGIPVLATNRLASVAERLTTLRPELGVIVAYGGLVREPLLSLPEHGWINLHFSLLPRWRGAAPVQHAVIAGDEVTGASVFRLVEELDAGPVYGRVTQAIRPEETAGRLLETLSESGAVLLNEVVEAIAAGVARAEEQQGDVTFAPKLTIEDGRIDWRQPAALVHARIRGVTPEPGAYTFLEDSRIKVLEAAVAHGAAAGDPGEVRQEGARVLVGTGSEPIELRRVHPAGRTAMAAADWWRGLPGDRARMS